MSIGSGIGNALARAVSYLLPPKFMKRRRAFPIWQARGYHVTPVHFYQPVPDTRTLRDELWSRPSELIGIDLREQAQLELLSGFVDRFKPECDAIARERTDEPNQYHVLNRSYGPVDGEILYCMIRHFKPRRIFEIGSGFSTRLAAQAVLKNKEADGCESELVAFEPYADEGLKRGFPGLTRLVETKIEDVPLDEFAQLGENDILFIDSSHVLKLGSDVQYEYLEILPRLNAGVIVHIHDIFLPAEYPRQWAMEKRIFWTEQYILQAFLSCNDSFEVLWAGNFMHQRHAGKLAEAFTSYGQVPDWTGPGSFWMKRIK